MKVYVGMTDMDKMSVGFMEIVNSYQHEAIPAERIFIHPLLGSTKVSTHMGFMFIERKITRITELHQTLLLLS